MHVILGVNAFRTSGQVRLASMYLLANGQRSCIGSIVPIELDNSRDGWQFSLEILYSIEHSLRGVWVLGVQLNMVS